MPDTASDTAAPSVFRLLIQPRVVRGALQVSLVVGTILNLVNQGDRLLGGHGVDPWRVLLNFVVPYCVSSWSAARHEARHLRAR